MQPVSACWRDNLNMLRDWTFDVYVQNILCGVSRGADLRTGVVGSGRTVYDRWCEWNLRQQFTDVGASGEPHSTRSGNCYRFDPATAESLFIGTWKRQNNILSLLLCVSEMACSAACRSRLYSAVEMPILQRWGWKNLSWWGSRRRLTGVLMSPARAKRLSLPFFTERLATWCNFVCCLFSLLFVFSIFYTVHFVYYVFVRRVIFNLLLSFFLKNNWH